ncbi:hypothetical protein HZC35_06385 [Candidatus Saganbacteria bacterium]|nr:hypothetical protein [Candidatus Saganbacteria bacterium]
MAKLRADGLRANIKGLRFRASDGKLGAADQLRILRKRMSNPAGIQSIRVGDGAGFTYRYLGMRQPVALKISVVDSAFAAAEVGAAAVSQASKTKISKIKLPEMIDDSRLPFRAARGIIPGSLLNGRKLAASINEQNPGRKFRVPTEPELLKLNGLLGDRLEGTDYWIWTETEHEAYPGQFVLHHLDNDYRSGSLPVSDCNGFAVRFVEDLPVR